MEVIEDIDYSHRKVDLKVWKKIIKIIFKNKKSLFLMILSVIVLATLDIIYPLLNSYAVEHFFDVSDPTLTTNEQIFKFMLCYIGIAVGYGIVVYSFLKLTGHIEVEVSYTIRKEAFNKLQELPFSYYDKTPSGWIMSRLTSDSRRLSSVVSWSLQDM